MNKFESPQNNIESNPEPLELLEKATLMKLKELYPGFSDDALRSIRGSFLYDILHSLGLPPFLHHFTSEEQKEKIISVLGVDSVEKGIDKILINIQSDIVEFYRKKLGSPTPKKDILEM